MCLAYKDKALQLPAHNQQAQTRLTSPSATGRRAVVVGGKRRERGSIWIHAVFMRSHGLCGFSMIVTARPGAMMVSDIMITLAPLMHPSRCHESSEK